ncbi:hypothetical protein RYH80_09045 [Halobaculum sp. MBLA0147]|uniref:hypothetical protein n=1 Tax=Halobaculum sp. MBLA0147 TaxID=3079934 RepID=UPI0035246A33
MDELSPPGDAAEVEAAIDRALGDVELEPDEAAEVLGYANRELAPLQTPETTYFVLGSYREPYVRRLRTVADELNARVGSYAYVLGDLPEMDLSRLPEFEIRFHVVAAYTDTVVGVYEQDAGGEVTELGKVSDSPYFERTHVLPRDYFWIDDHEIDSRAELLAAVVAAYDDDGDEAERETRVTELIEAAAENGVDVERSELEADARARLADGDLPAYSWVHRNEFRLFDLAGRCHSWVSVDRLRERAAEVP